jgi:hypothetical protein
MLRTADCWLESRELLRVLVLIVLLLSAEGNEVAGAVGVIEGNEVVLASIKLSCANEGVEDVERCCSIRAHRESNVMGI